MATLAYCFIVASLIWGTCASPDDQTREEDLDHIEDRALLSEPREEHTRDEDNGHPDALVSGGKCGENDETCKREDSEFVPCSHLPGGLRRLTLGVHIANLTLRPLDYVAPDGYALPVVGLTCRRGKTWTNQQNSIVYQRPDEIDNIHNINSGNLVSSSETMKSSYDVKDSIGGHIETPSILRVLSGSLSSSFNYMTQEIRKKERMITEVSAFTAAVSVQFKDFDIGLDEHAQAFLDKLPDDITKDREGYAKFVNLFGTHYFREGKLGGILKSTTTTEVKKMTDISEFDFSAQLKLGLDSLIKASMSVGVSYKKRTLTSNFSSASVTKVRFYGGNTNLLEKDGIKKWQPTVYDEPWVYWGSFREVYHLLDRNDKKREQLKIAVQSHLNKDFKDHLTQTFSEVFTVYKMLGLNVNVLTELKTSLNKEANSEYPLFSELSKIDKKLRSIVNPPAWWKKVQICADVWGDFDYRKSLSGINPPEEKITCANTGSFTDLIWMPVYMSNWYQRSFLKWGIMTNGPFDPYFKQVELCVLFRGHFDYNLDICSEAYGDDTYQTTTHFRRQLISI